METKNVKDMSDEELTAACEKLAPAEKVYLTPKEIATRQLLIVDELNRDRKRNDSKTFDREKLKQKIAEKYDLPASWFQTDEARQLYHRDEELVLTTLSDLFHGVIPNFPLYLQ